MSLNKFMHPRNLYRNPPNFKELAIQFSDFRQFAKQDLSGKVQIDFKDADALRALTRTLLLKDFNLKVEIPPDRLVPTLPLRLNYLLWIDDIVKENNISNEQIKGIDIGTGASCIYPLLAARHFKWQMLGTEVDSTSFDIATKNVTNNQLQGVITLKQVENESVLHSVVEPDDVYTFCMCNPPFFSNEEELVPESVSRRPNRPRPRNAASGSPLELVSPGGECSFVKRIIDDSHKLKCQIRFYSVMVGHKSSVSTVKGNLKESGVTNISTTEFCQGYTTRWGIAWSYDPGIILMTESRMSSVKKNKTPFTFVLNTSHALTEVVEKIKVILAELQIKTKIIKFNSEFCAMEVNAETNTWSNQRRRRRLKQQQLKSSIEIPLAEQTMTEENRNTGDSKSDLCKIKNNLKDESADSKIIDSNTDEKSDLCLTADNDKKTLKRQIKNNEPEGSLKKIKIVFENTDNKINNNGPLLSGSLVIRSVSKSIMIELFYLRGTGGRESAHQVLQYLKNKFLL